MNRQGKAFLLSLIIHLLVLVFIASVSSSFMGANDCMVIDLALMDIQDGSEETMPRNAPVSGRSVPALRARSERSLIKAAMEAQTETIPLSKAAFVPPAMEIHSSVPIPSAYAETISGPTNQSLRDSRGYGENRPGSSVSGQIVEKGSGSGADSGKASTSEGEGNPGNFHEQLRQRYISQHFAYIKKIIQRNIAYPQVARKAGWMGKVTVSFIVLENGHTDSIRILKSSGYGILDNNVIRTIREISPFPKPPVKAELQMPIIYQLE